MEIKGLRRKLFSVTIKDCRVDTFTVGGHGGAGKDTSNTGVRVSHLPSHAVGVSSDTRSQRKNKEAAFTRMAQTKEFQLWARLKAAELSTGKTVDELVEEDMRPEKLKVEVRTQKGWEILSKEIE
jgi:protein subunit release factor A